MSIRELSHMLAATSKPWRLKALDCVGFHEVEDNQRVQRVASHSMYQMECSLNLQP